jgi:hypothetical protein
MKKILTLLIFLYFLTSCERRESNFSEEMIEKLADRSEIKNDSMELPPPPIVFSNAYILIDSGEVAILNENELFFFYKRDYFKKIKSFKDFLNAALNDDLVLEKNIFKHANYPKRFKLNSKIEKEYSDLGFDKFLKKYSKETVSKRLILNRTNVKDGEYLTIAYILFKNGCDISSDCYLGIDYIIQRKDSFK